ncbi:MAG: ABC transporter permease, partial [Burkholderiales bacterium]|nr:ABC transporter permease [Burkholderiales bacterium]
MDGALIASIVAATLVAGTPLIIAALGELVAERAGVLNLGVEGMMSVGALAAFVTYQGSSNAPLAVAAGLAAGVAMSLLFALLTLSLLANQVASGLALAIFGVGLSAFAGKPYESAAMPMPPSLRLPGLADIPLAGPALFNQPWPVYGSWLLVGAVAWFLYRSRAGLALRAVGESPGSAHSIGYPVIAIRYAAVAFGGAMAGVAGAFLSVYYTPLWSQGMVAGRGWIALALVVFATWRPIRVVLGAYLFGGVMISQLFLQGLGVHLDIPAQWLSALPYAATIVVLVLISRDAASL